MSQPLRILLVEDDALIALTLQDVLEEGGHQVDAVHDMTEALHRLEAAAPRYAALITDIRLGGSADGWLLAERARQAVPGIAIAYMSGDSERCADTRAVPGSMFLKKPFTAADLLRAVAALVHGAQPAHQS